MHRMQVLVFLDSNRLYRGFGSDAGVCEHHNKFETWVRVR